jgi:hypothetical protein
VTEHYTFYSPDAFPGKNGGKNMLDVASGLTLKDNYFACGGASLKADVGKNDKRTGNTFIGPVTVTDTVL